MNVLKVVMYITCDAVAVAVAGCFLVFAGWG